MLIATCLIFMDCLEKVVQILLCRFFLLEILMGLLHFFKAGKLSFNEGKNHVRIQNYRFFMDFILGLIFDLLFDYCFFYFLQMIIYLYLKPDCMIITFSWFKLENRMNIFHYFKIEFIFIKYLIEAHLILYHIKIVQLHQLIRFLIIFLPN